MANKPTWRADFFDSIDDTKPSRSVLTIADTQDEAGEQAAAQMGSSSSVNVVRVVSK